MQIKQIYNILHKKAEIHGDNPRNSLEYQIIKKYEDPAETIRTKQLLSGINQPKKKILKRGSYLEDQYAVKKHIPGPGTYTTQIKEESAPRKRAKSQKKTYLGEIMEKSNKQKFPGPGKYEVLKKMGESSMRSVSSQKRIKTDKIDYLDNAEYYGMLTPGVGEYDINRYEKSIREQKKHKDRKSPEFWKQKHRQQSLKTLPKLPEAATYNPKPSAYELFSQKSKINQFNSFEKVNNKHRNRIKTQAKDAHLGPGKYNIIHEWKKSVKDEKGLLDNISTGIPKRVYY